MLIIYVLKNCPKCKILTKYLNSLGIHYEERDAQEYVKMLMSKGFFTAPVLQIDNEFLNFISINGLILILRERGYQV